MSYQIKLDLSKASLTLRLFETVDLSETSEIKEALTNEPKAGADKLIVDGGHIDYLDSSAVALLLFSKRVAADNGMTCEFLPFSEEAFKVINMAGLQSTFKAKKIESAPSETGAEETAPELFSDDTEDLEGGIDLDDFDTGELELDMDDSSPLQSQEDEKKDSDDLDFKPGDFS